MGAKQATASNLTNAAETAGSGSGSGENADSLFRHMTSHGNDSQFSSIEENEKNASFTNTFLSDKILMDNSTLSFFNDIYNRTENNVNKLVDNAVVTTTRNNITSVDDGNSSLSNSSDSGKILIQRLYDYDYLALNKSLNADKVNDTKVEDLSNSTLASNDTSAETNSLINSEPNNSTNAEFSNSTITEPSNSSITPNNSTIGDIQNSTTDEPNHTKTKAKHHSKKSHKSTNETNFPKEYSSNISTIINDHTETASNVTTQDEILKSIAEFPPIEIHSDVGTFLMPDFHDIFSHHSKRSNKKASRYKRKKRCNNTSKNNSASLNRKNGILCMPSNGNLPVQNHTHYTMEYMGSTMMPSEDNITDSNHTARWHNFENHKTNKKHKSKRTKRKLKDIVGKDNILRFNLNNPVRFDDEAKQIMEKEKDNKTLANFDSHVDTMKNGQNRFDYLGLPEKNDTGENNLLGGVEEKELKKGGKEGNNETKFVATPVIDLDNDDDDLDNCTDSSEFVAIKFADIKQSRNKSAELLECRDLTNTTKLDADKEGSADGNSETREKDDKKTPNKPKNATASNETWVMGPIVTQILPPSRVIGVKVKPPNCELTGTKLDKDCTPLNPCCQSCKSCSCCQSCPSSSCPCCQSCQSCPCSSSGNQHDKSCSCCNQNTPDNLEELPNLHQQLVGTPGPTPHEQVMDNQPHPIDGHFEPIHPNDDINSHSADGHFEPIHPNDIHDDQSLLGTSYMNTPQTDHSMSGFKPSPYASSDEMPGSNNDNHLLDMHPPEISYMDNNPAYPPLHSYDHQFDGMQPSYNDYQHYLDQDMNNYTPECDYNVKGCNYFFHKKERLDHLESKTLGGNITSSFSEFVKYNQSFTDKRAMINIDITNLTPVKNGVRVIDELDRMKNKLGAAIGQIRSSSIDNSSFVDTNSSLSETNATKSNATAASKYEVIDLDDASIADDIENATNLHGNIQFNLIDAGDVCNETNSSINCLENRAMSADYVSENIGQDMYDLYTGQLNQSRVANNETLKNDTNSKLAKVLDKVKFSKDASQAKIAKLPSPSKHKKTKNKLDNKKMKKISSTKAHKAHKGENRALDDGGASRINASDVTSPLVSTDVGEDAEDFDDEDEGPDNYPHGKKVIEGGSDENDESRFETYIKSHSKKYEKDLTGGYRVGTHHTGHMRHHLHRHHLHHASPYMDSNDYPDFMSNSHHTGQTFSNDVSQMNSLGSDGHMVYTSNPCHMHECNPSYHSQDNIYRYTPHYIPEHSIPIAPSPGSHEGDLLAHWSEEPHRKPVKVYNTNSSLSATQFLDNTHYPELIDNPEMNYTPMNANPYKVANVQSSIANLRVTGQHKDSLHNQVHLFTGPSVQVYKEHDNGRLGLHTQHKVQQILQHDHSVNALLHSGARKIGDGGDIVVDNGVAEGRVAMAHAGGHSSYDPLLSVGDQSTMGEPSLAGTISPVIDDTVMNGNSMINNEMNEQDIEENGENAQALLGLGNPALNHVLTHHDTLPQSNDMIAGKFDDQGDMKVLVDTPSSYMNEHHHHNEITLCNGIGSPGCDFFHKQQNRTN